MRPYIYILIVENILHIYIHFAEYSLFYRALLQKSPIICRSLLMYIHFACVWRCVCGICGVWLAKYCCICIHIYCIYTNTYSSTCVWDLLHVQRYIFEISYISGTFLCIYIMKCTMGWLRLVGSYKLLVSFAKEPGKRDYILLHGMAMGWLRLVGSFKL